MADYFKPPEAIEVFNQGIEKNDQFADLHNNLGYAYFELGEYGKAVAKLNDALSINPDYAEAHFNLGQVLLKVLQEGIEDEQLPDPETSKKQALEHLMTAAELMPPKNLKHFDKIYEYIGDDQFAPAFDLLDAIKASSHERFKVDFENEFYLKFMFGGRGKDDEFILQYTNDLLEAIEEYPKYADLRNNLGIVYLIQCRNLFLKALDEFRQAIKINPSFKKAEKNLEEFYLRV